MASFPTTGDDSIFGTAGPDNIDALAGRDTVRGGDGNDTLLGNDGSDSLLGELGDDKLYGGRGSDSLVGLAGNDTADGGNLNDTLHGYEGNDILYGAADYDWLNGGPNNDRLIGGRGTDTLLGEGGVDRFVFRAASESGGAVPTHDGYRGNVDVIMDLEAKDRIKFTADASEFTDLRANGDYEYELGGAASLNAALDKAAASGFDTDANVEAFIFIWLGSPYLAVEDVASNPGSDFDEGADLVVKLNSNFPASTVLTEANFI
jgi:Ca2+-binding RTX toxin-like protein